MILRDLIFYYIYGHVYHVCCICWFTIHEHKILILFKTCLNIIFHIFVKHLNSSFVLSGQHMTQIMYGTFFFINGIIDPITGDVINTHQYKKLNHNKTWLRNVENWLTVGYPILRQNSLKILLELWYFSPQVQNVMITLQKEQENPLKSVFVFKPGIKSLHTVYPWALRLYHPSAPLYNLQLFLRLYRSASGWYNLSAHV